MFLEVNMSAQNNSSSLSDLLQRTRGNKSGFFQTNSSGVSDNLNVTPKSSAKVLNQNHHSNLVSTSAKLQLLEQTLEQVESQRSSHKEQIISEAQASVPTSSELKKPGLDLPPLESSPVSSSKKEVESSARSSVEQGASVQVVETEKSPELSPEVEKYLQEVHKDQNKAPKEIAISDEIANLPSDNQFVSEPVIVVPITPEIEKRGKRKSSKFSIRWLVEWSQKIIKMFSGKVVYLEPSSDKS